MRSLVFDTGPVISIAMNHILGILRLLRAEYRGRFLITSSVKRELVDRPLEIKSYMFEALQTLRCISSGVLEVVEAEDVHALGLRLESLANNLFEAQGSFIRIVHIAEMETLAAAIIFRADAVVVDERTTRLLLEQPEKLRFILSHKLHTPVSVNSANWKEFMKLTAGIRCIRSVELVLIAYEKGLLDKYLPGLPDARKILLDAVLWGVKLDGCSVSRKEIDRIVSLELKGK